MFNCFWIVFRYLISEVLCSLTKKMYINLDPLNSILPVHFLEIKEQSTGILPPKSTLDILLSSVSKEFCLDKKFSLEFESTSGVFAFVFVCFVGMEFWKQKKHLKTNYQQKIKLFLELIKCLIQTETLMIILVKP